MANLHTRDSTSTVLPPGAPPRSEDCIQFVAGADLHTDGQFALPRKLPRPALRHLPEPPQVRHGQVSYGRCIIQGKPVNAVYIHHTPKTRTVARRVVCRDASNLESREAPHARQHIYRSPATLSIERKRLFPVCVLGLELQTNRWSICRALYSQ